MNKPITFALSLFFAGALHAAPASPQSIETLLQLAKSEAMMESMYSGMEEVMRQALSQASQGTPLSAEQQRVMDAVPGKFLLAIKEETNWTKMKPAYVQLYRETFEQEEIDGLIAFYTSPTGQAFIKKMPIVMQKSIALSQAQMQLLFPKMEAVIKEAMREAKVEK